MNLFGTLVILFLFFSKTLLDNYPLWVTCAPDYFQVIMDRDLFRNGTTLLPEQVTLGQGCQVSTVLEDKFFFLYSVLDCGIQREMKWNLITFHSILHYRSLDVDGDVRDIPLACSIDEERLNRPAMAGFPPPSVGVVGMYVPDSPSSTTGSRQHVGPREEGRGPQNPGSATLAWKAVLVPTVLLASSVS